MMESIITSGRACTGCSACGNSCPKSAISMRLTDGFYKPVIDAEKCVSCGRCVSVCPQNSDIKVTDFPTEAYACKNKDDTVRIKSSSGGVFSVLAESILSDGGVVYGVAFDDQFLTKHIRVDSIDELEKLRRSKYLQSDVGDSLIQVKKDLASGRRVLFSGTPCQCAGLDAYLNGKRENLIMVEVLCHGVPSPVIWKNYLAYRVKKSKSSSEVENCMFHTKDTSPKASWSRSFMNIRMDGEEYNVLGNNDPFMVLFARSDIILNDACYECRYRQHFDRGYVDISLCDFWGIDKVNPSLNDDQGISLIMLHSQKGICLVSACGEKLSMTQVEPQRAWLLNHASRQPERKNLNQKVREMLIRRPASFGWIYYTYLPVIFGRKTINKIRNLLKRH